MAIAMVHMTRWPRRGPIHSCSAFHSITRLTLMPAIDKVENRRSGHDPLQ